MPAFFVPEVPAEKQEEVYTALAHRCGCAVPQPKDRVYSIRFRHDGEDWTATVGEELRGTKTVTKGRGRNKIERSVPLSNSSKVVAIFDGVPFFVWHNGASHIWANPFMAGRPYMVTLFSD